MLIPKIEQRILQYMRFLKPLRYRDISPLYFETFETEEKFRAPPDGIHWEKINTPYPYGRPWHCVWFRSEFKTSAQSAYPLYLRAIPNADSLAFIDGKPVGAFNPFHKKIKIPADGAEHTLHIESYAGHPYPGCHPLEKEVILCTLSQQIPAYPNIFEGATLVERIEPVYSLYYDVRCLFELAQVLDHNSLRKARILKGLYDALTGIHFNSTGGIVEKESAQAAEQIAPLLKSENSPTTPEIYLIGHAHIDHAWLWHIGETERKVARTYMNMVRFSEEYPDFIFIQTQPAQLESVKNNYPDIFASVKDAYRKANWEPNGGMWVEADCNIPGGESLIRQFLVGKAVNNDLLGYEADTLWLPDVFGYAAALPQILDGCRIKYFVTSKINWNDTTRFPYDTFIWRGIDGTGVKTHYISSRTEGYNGRVSPAGLAEIWGEIQHKELQSGAIKSIGEGDGGGGTTRSDLEMARRLGNLEGAPKAAWKSVSSALDRIFSASDEWPEWRGELYLELHRGTYTTQARTKRYNRKLEFALRRTEFFFATAAAEGLMEYPSAALLKCWKMLLTNQFHDIIPGSSIHRVYVEAEEQYRQIESTLDGLIRTFIQKMVTPGAGRLILFNDLSWERTDPVVISGSTAGFLRSGQKVYALQPYTDLDGADVGVCTPVLPALGWASFTLDDAALPASPFVYHDGFLTTPFYRVQFDETNGRIISLIDRKNREWVAAGGSFNRLVSAQDLPVLWEAWDIDADWTKYLTEETGLIKTEVAADGPVCFRIRREYRIAAASTLVQDSVFYAENPRIDFETKVEWHERRQLLKVGFDTALDATQVRCEVQYGHLLRNTHRNLPHDRAKFEICAHKWICLEEAGRGIALLNDCKYGHDVAGGSMRLTLLRSPIAPDPEADQGEHHFIYSLLPFAGSFAESGIVRAGYELNTREVQAGVTGTTNVPDFSFFTLDEPAIIAESIKAPESAQPGAVLLRLYESLGAQTRSVLHFYRELAAVFVTDMLEDTVRQIPCSGKDLDLEFRAFEIKTLMLTFR
ncbi:alpha-mannosidase [Spirochaetia bacterium]|nr:alpha-mannosidase [Spirochaetia bacterium]GHU32319.1 alpha-mannosidase [Spirochaetia bacterium]